MNADRADSEQCLVDIVDGDDNFRRRSVEALQAHGMQAVAYRDLDEYVSRWNDTPSCLVVDLRLPGPAGTDLWEAIGKSLLRPPVIAVASRIDVPTAVRAIKSGAVNCLAKPVTAGTLVASIRTAVARDPNGRAIRRATRDICDRYASLNELERATFVRMARGVLSKQLSFELQAAERTIKRRRASVMRKMHTSSLVHLVQSARVLGLVRDCRS